CCSHILALVWPALDHRYCSSKTIRGFGSRVQPVAVKLVSEALVESAIEPMALWQVTLSLAVRIRA
ncbi:uncharacterized protein Bfra_000630, partial [Botrytis fragariae]